MEAERIELAVQRIEAALARIASAAEAVPAQTATSAAAGEDDGLRVRVAEILQDLDGLIGTLEQ